ncbi:MAG: nucleotidyl transferase AbiEii/AbiGii toxin family protein [Acidimicrobiia bacterium]|nr:MAG: nucleotidyl transferase AbiEii/AbiGii toxin family protein [Acidimicrobiia bacterium]
MRITEGYLSRHYQGRSGGRDPALLDIAQDYALVVLHRAGVFDLNVVLKGGTALRKFRAGNAGRFSTDLDFACEDNTTAALVLESIDGTEIDGFSFRLERRDSNRRADLRVSTPLGTPNLPARIDLSTRGLWLLPDVAEMVPLPIHKRYDIDLPATPVMRLEEVMAEKLARYRRTSLARDLYDLQWCAEQKFDEALVRRLWVLKSFFDIVDDQLASGPVDPSDVLSEHEESVFTAEQIGYLTRLVDIAGWEHRVRSRYTFLASLDDDEQRWANANPADRWSALQAVTTIEQI